jgi:hypothetical protein
MRPGVAVAVACLPSEISTLMGKVNEDVCVRKWIRKRNKHGASSMSALMKELASEDRELHKNHLSMSTTLVLAYTYHQFVRHLPPNA